MTLGKFWIWICPNCYKNIKSYWEPPGFWKCPHCFKLIGVSSKTKQKIAIIIPHGNT